MRTVWEGLWFYLLWLPKLYFIPSVVYRELAKIEKDRSWVHTKVLIFKYFLTLKHFKNLVLFLDYFEAKKIHKSLPITTLPDNINIKVCSTSAETSRFKNTESFELSEAVKNLDIFLDSLKGTKSLRSYKKLPSIYVHQNLF